MSGDDAGMASVLGAILLFGLVVSTLVTVQAQYVPVWDHQREARLMDAMAGQMAAVQGELARQVANRSTAPVGLPMPLAPAAGLALFQGTSLPGTLSFQPSPGPAGLLTLASTRLTLQPDGPGLYALSEDWQAIASGATVANVAEVQHLRVRVHSLADAPDGSTLTLTVLDAAGAYAGKFVLTKIDQDSDYALRTQVFAPASATAAITDGLQSWKHTTPNPDYYADLLEGTLGFDAVLRANPGPFSLKWTSTIPNAEAALVYLSSTAGQVGNTGVVVPNYSHPTASGRLVAARANQRFPQQAYTLEYGALIVDQADGAAMVAPPAFSVRLSNGQALVSWTVPQLTGPAAQVGGARAAQVAVVPLGPRTTLHALAPRLTITVGTTHPAVWQAYWTTALRDAGLDPATGQFLVSTTATTATLDLFGPAASPSDLSNDLHLDYAEASLAVAIVPSG